MSCQKESLVQTLQNLCQQSGLMQTSPPNTLMRSFNLETAKLTQWNISYAKLLKVQPFQSNSVRIRAITYLTYSNPIVITLYNLTGYQPSLEIFGLPSLFYATNMTFSCKGTRETELLRVRISDNICIVPNL